MNLRQILEKATENLSLSIDLTEPNSENALLISCGNAIISQLVEEYIDVKKVETVISVDKKIPYAELKESVKNVYAIKANGKSVKFHEYADHIAVDKDATYEITYSYVLGEKGLDDVIVIPPKYTVNILAVGVAGEYAYRKGFLEEGRELRTRYLIALKNLEKTAKSVRLKEVNYG